MSTLNKELYDWILDAGTETKHIQTALLLLCTLVFQIVSLKIGTAASQWRQIFFPQCLHCLDCAPWQVARDTQALFPSTKDNLPEILLPDDVGPAVDAIGQGAHTDEGGVCPLIELVRGV